MPFCVWDLIKKHDRKIRTAGPSREVRNRGEVVLLMGAALQPSCFGLTVQGHPPGVRQPIPPVGSPPAAISVTGLLFHHSRRVQSTISQFPRGLYALESHQPPICFFPLREAQNPFSAHLYCFLFSEPFLLRRDAQAPASTHFHSF